MANSVNPDQTAPMSGSTLVASILKFVIKVRQLFAADVIFQLHFFLAL